MILCFRLNIAGLLTTSIAACAVGGPAEDTKVTVIKADGYDVSSPLRELAKIPMPELLGFRAREAEPVRLIPHMHQQSAVQQQDPVVQRDVGAGPNTPSLITSFEGMGAGLPGFTVQAAPPDSDGDIGPNHFVQIVNSSVTIFSRAGAKLLGPVLTRTFFANFAAGTNCQNTNDGDGVVRYDRYADRWIIAQFSVNGGNGPFFQCVAVSTTPDPTGSYNRYQFSYGATGFNDYPRIGLWPDAYYMTYNIFTGNTFSGAKSCAFDRAKMLIGAAATQMCFDTGNTIGGLLPSDVDGATLPPAGSPNFQLALDTNLLVFFKMHVDFANPANSTFTGPTFITTAAFTPLCNGGTCVVQPGTTNRLDSLSDRLMNRLVYRNFGDHEALLVSHAVAAGTGGGIRFYELRSPATTPTIFQQGTYAPDSAFRWMSSMAFDGAGNIGMVFSISSSAINPSIRYTGRLTTDPLGTMGQGEATIIAGTGSQTGNLTRWGDYTSLHVDPSPACVESIHLAPTLTLGCKLWSVSEYPATSGSFNWHTRVGSFAFSNPDAPINDFSITPRPTPQAVVAGASATYTINTAVLSGSAETIALSVSELPAGVMGSFDPPSVIAGGSSTLTLTAAATAGAGTTSFTITGTGTSVTRTASASVTVVNNNQPPTVSFTSPTNSSTVSSTIAVSANATDANGTVASVRFDLPDGTSVTDTTAPFSTTFDTTRVVDGGGHVFRVTATDNQGATGTASVTVTVANGGGGCLNNTFNATSLPLNIPDNNATGITSNLAVVGNGTVASLSLSLNITHTFRGDLVVTLISPGGTQFIVSNRAGGSADNIVISNQLITAFNGQTAAGTWKLKVQDLAAADIGTLNSWSLTVVGNCNSVVHWSGSAMPNLPTIDNGTACSSLTVTTTGGDSSIAKLDISGSHDFRSSLRGTLAHNGVTVEAFSIGTFPTSAGTFSFTNRPVPRLSGAPSGTWTLCFFDTDALGDTGVLNTWSVHD